MTERREREIALLDKVVGRQCRGLPDLVLAWKATLQPARLAVFAELELRLRIGVAFTPLAGGRWAASITATDSHGNVQVLDTIEQVTALPSEH
ncbi:MAG: hypothetical protein ABI624_10075 [Casimicrobiaceae bacterium]